MVDILSGNQIIEIQTSGFAQIRNKLAALLSDYQVTLVHPIARVRTLVRTDAEGKKTDRKSPKRGSLADLFAELVYMPELLQDENMTLDVVFTDEEEIRLSRKSRSRRGSRWLRQGRRLREVLEVRSFASMTDLFDEFREGLPDPFSTRQLATVLDRTVRVGRQAAYCFRKSGVIRVCGKEGNALLYTATRLAK